MFGSAEKAASAWSRLGSYTLGLGASKMTPMFKGATARLSVSAFESFSRGEENASCASPWSDTDFTSEFT